MNSRAVTSFWDGYGRLPERIRKAADEQYRLWEENPTHPSLHFKKVGRFWSARVTLGYRALGVMDGETIVWFFIGSHAEYDRLLKRR
jgi:hypothetical protein